MKKGINQELMRATNKNQILLAIRKNAPVTVKDLADRLGLSITSVTTFINELSAAAKIESCGAAKSTGGRKSALYRLNPDAQYFLGMDLQVDRIVLVMLDFSGNLVQSAEIALPNKDEWRVASQINELMARFVAELQIPPLKLGGVGIGVPGIVNQKTGLIEFAPNLGWKNVDLGLLLDLKVPFRIENEANAAAWGEKNFGAAREAANMIFISVGIGIGCGLIIENRLFAGPAFQAGEFGHMTLFPDGIPCQCGNNGCWEVYASNEAALQRYTRITGQKLGHYEDLLRLYHQADPAAVTVLTETIQCLGLGIANIVNGLNPEMVVIGGKIIEAEMLFPPLLKEIKAHSLDKTFSGLSIRFSGLQNKAAAWGVAGMMMD